MMDAAGDHAKTHVWTGWAEATIGLELQSPYAEYVLDGRKKIETRAYALPPDLISSNGKHVKIEILESEKGKDGVSSIPNVVSVNNDEASMMKRRGWCTITRSFRYRSREQFEADVEKHLVEPSSGYGWTEGRPMYGWVVGTCGVYSSDDVKQDDYVAERRMRSIFELTMKSTILITGASGMLGRALHRLLLSSPSSSKYNIIGTGNTRLEVDHYPEYFTPSNNVSDDIEPKPPKTVKLHQLNLLDFDATTDFLHKHRPDIIVHCAAERYPDAFETKLEESKKLNVESTRHLAKECLRLAREENDKEDCESNKIAGPSLIYISTSYVFDGGIVSKEFPPYKPDSKANPLNSYGMSKWEGECVVRDVLNSPSNGGKGSAHGQGIVVRVPLLYGEDCCDLSESPALDMMKVFLSSASQTHAKKKIDHWAPRFPTSVEDVARVLNLMIERILGNKFPEESSSLSNTYHVASPYETTKYNLMQLQTKLLNIPTTLVEERTVGDSSGPPENAAPRPKCTQLDCSQTWKALGMDGAYDQFEFVSLENGMKRALDGFPGRFMEK